VLETRARVMLPNPMRGLPQRTSCAPTSPTATARCEPTRPQQFFGAATAGRARATRSAVAMAITTRRPNALNSSSKSEIRRRIPQRDRTPRSGLLSPSNRPG
jgi:hypothetical protein